MAKRSTKRAIRRKEDIPVNRSNIATRLIAVTKDFLTRRPHRSFRRTPQRDAHRSMQIPGYIQFTADVAKVLWSQRRLFGLLTLTYAAITIIFVGLGSQEIYTEFSAILDESAKNGGAIFQAGLLLVAGVTGGFNVQLNDVQQVYAILLALLTWLTTVWLLRSVLSGNSPRLRDGIYSAGSPIVASVIVTAYILVQLLPVAIGVLVFNNASSAGMLESGFMAMVSSIILALLGILSVYWVVTSVFAMVIVTLPGMYPWQAIRVSGDIVTGRRLRIVLRIAWLLLFNTVLGGLVLLPVILLDRALTGLTDLFRYIPLVPLTMAILGSLLVVWSAAYVYLLYRKVVEDDASPA